MKSFERVLAIGAHTDDIELGCGGYLSRLRREGTQLMVAAFSRAESSLGEGMPVDTLENEFRNSMTHLCVTDNLYVGSVPVRYFPNHRQEILEELVRIRREFNPDLVLTMNSEDSHQDHSVVHAESLRAFRGVTVLGYELPWNQRVSRNDLFIELQAADLDTKVAMTSEYHSQATLKRSYMDPEYLRSAATFRGYQGRLPLAEMYEILTMVWTN